MANTIEFNKKCIPAPDYVVLEIINRNDKFTVGKILVAESCFSNERVCHAKVLAVGKNAEKEYGLKIGDYVVADRLATVAQTAPVALIKYCNIIAKTNEDNTKFSPLRNMVFVKDEQDQVSKVGTILVQNYKKKLNIGRVVAMNLDSDVEVPYSVGDNVLIAKGGDSFQIGDDHVFIYKHDMLCCKVIDE